MPRRTRIRVAKGIYRDEYGLAGVVKVGAAQREKRYPFETDLDDIRQWQQETKGHLLLEHPTRGMHTRTTDPFNRSVSRYLALIEGRPGYASDRAHLAAWVDVFGARPRGRLTSEDVRLAFAQWRVEGQRRPHQKTERVVSPQTLRHRYRVLKRLFRVLDGASAKTPLDEIPRPAVPRTIPRDVPIETIRRVARALEQSEPQTHARFLVLASTGKSPAEVMRTTPSDLDLRTRPGLWRVKPAKQRNPQTLFLGPEMVAAWKRFAKVNAWGAYDTTRYARILRRHGWPEDVRPYNVRHALAMDLLRRGADISDIQAHLGHRSIETTRAHYAGVLEARAHATMHLLDARLAEPPARKTAKAKARPSASGVPSSRESQSKIVKKSESW